MKRKRPQDGSVGVPKGANAALLAWLDDHPGATSPEPIDPNVGPAPRADVRAGADGGGDNDFLAKWLRVHGVEDKDENEIERPSAPSFRDRPCDARIDLHGLKAAEAESALERFFEEASKRGFSKVLVIHGKGWHSMGEAVLARLARDVAERSAYTGKILEADRKDGGRGAIYVAIRSRASR
jgi:hypothetical protein